nr:immunoglobulin light chain junction region [Macaca mulatta]MOW66531.1 immunoglobulin light chain junction region [Macaca mulatta]MOW66884.1 immunoglobulin light chain junction region [Macaca mulatta]MOW66977.1 immunoglobulin light chain junction region [Macaca mulatta]MOW67041.1 immunoglobulin light chain junction region [Macaca mulatta]
DYYCMIWYNNISGLF